MAIGRVLCFCYTRLHRCQRLLILVGSLIFFTQLYLAYHFVNIHFKDTPPALSYDGPIDNNPYTDDDDNPASNLLGFKHGTNVSTRMNDTHLNPGEVDFTLTCSEFPKEAISAISRAKSKSCKALIANVSCLIQRNEFYPESLPSSCPNAGHHYGRLLGCYEDDKHARVLNGYYANYRKFNSPHYCIQMCLQSGFPYAGVQYSTECFCGTDRPPTDARLPDSSCNMQCPSNTKQACGGYFAMNVYETGIAGFKSQPAEMMTVVGSKPVNIAYLLTLNGRALRQVKRLIKALYHHDHFFYIHVDVRQDYLFRELLPLEKKFHNIRIARDRFATIWGGASLLQTLLSSMRVMLDWARWDFVINLSESDYPIKRRDDLIEYLTANRNRNFVKSHGRETQRFIQKQGLDKTFVECDARMWRVGDRRLPRGIHVDGGSDWVALSRSFVEFVTGSSGDIDPASQQLIDGLLKVFKYTLLPAESFFHTVLRNSKFCDTYVDNNLHVTNWKRKLGCKCQYRHVVDWCGCSPNNFRADDWPRIYATQTKQLFFARKFEPVISQSVINQLDEWMYGEKFDANLVNLNSYWQNVYHHADMTATHDDVSATLGNSVIRTFLKTRECEQIESKVNQIITFHTNDTFRGFVVNFETHVKMEVYVQVNAKVLVNKAETNGLVKRLKSLIISSDFDQKEQTSRNFIRHLSPYSDVYSVFEFTPTVANTNHNLTFVWIDTNGVVVDVSFFNVDHNAYVHFVKLNAKAPLVPGVWTLKIISSQAVVAQTPFLILPLEFVAKKSLSETQAILIHGNINVDSLDVYAKYGKSLSERERLNDVARLNAKKTGGDLRAWIDDLVMEFYTIVDSCSVSGYCNVENRCVTSDWSSYAPDPKCDLGYRLGQYNS